MAEPQPQTADLFYRKGTEYYLLGRAGCRFGCAYTTGNILHDAVEMMLKGKLSETHTLRELKDNFQHDLPKCWKAFRKLYPSDTLSEFDSMIDELHKFAEVRYPDTFTKHQVAIGVGFGRWNTPPASGFGGSVRQYQMGIGFVDSFFARFFDLCHMNAKNYFFIPNDEGKRILQFENAECKDWL